MTNKRTASRGDIRDPLAMDIPVPAAVEQESLNVIISERLASSTFFTSPSRDCNRECRHELGFITSPISPVTAASTEPKKSHIKLLRGTASAVEQRVHRGR